MARPLLELKAREIAREHITWTIKIKGLRQWTWRLQIAYWFIRLAAFIAWIEVEIVGPEPQEIVGKTEG